MTPLNSLAEAAQKLYDSGHVALADEMLFLRQHMQILLPRLEAALLLLNPVCADITRALENLRTAE